MGSGGTEWESVDTFLETRLNQKTRFVGNSDQINTLITSPQIGQVSFSTSTGSGFSDNKTYVRNAANTTWNTNLVTSTAYSQGGLSGATSTSDANMSWINRRRYSFITIPTTYKFYLFTEMGIGPIYWGPSAETLQIVFGADLVDAIPPTIQNTPLVAISTKFTSVSANSNAGNGTSQQIASKPVIGGTKLGLWWNATMGGSAPGSSYSLPRSSTDYTVYYKGETFTQSPETVNTTAWSTATYYEPSMSISGYGYY